MHFAFIRELFSGPVATAICWTLIHSLWEGLFFAIMTGIVLIGTRNSHPSLRYRVLSIQFLLFILAVLVTFIWEWNHIDTGSSLHYVTGNIFFSSSGDARPVIHPEQEYQFLNTVSVFLSNNASTLVAVWFMIFLVKSIKIVSSFFYLQHLRTHKIHQPSGYWKNRIVQLGASLQLTRTVQLLESEIIKVPAVFGHLKPVIFIPLGILTGLPPDQVEAVLLHELAHIRRSDYLFNMIQNIAETIFFFNPALLWMSSLIRQEREHCCDDIAIAQTKDKKQFIESLLRFREAYFHTHLNYVTAFPGTKNSFINRITRIAMNKNKSLNPAENIFLAISLVIIGTLVMAFCQVKEPSSFQAVPLINTTPVTDVPLSAPGTAVTAKMNSSVPVNDIVAKNKTSYLQPDTTGDDDYSVIYSDIDKSAGRETIVFKKGGNEYKLVKLNGEISYLMVNDQKVPSDKMGDYSDLLKKINAQLERMKKEQAIRDKEQEQRNEEQKIRNKEQEQRNADQVIRNKEQEKRNEEQASRNEDQKKTDVEQVIRNKEQEQRNADQIERNKEQDQRNEEQIIRNKEQEQRNAEQVIRNKEQEQRNAEQVIRNKEQEARNAEMKKLINDLIADNIIKDKNGLRSLSLTEDEFFVNGVKQSPEAFKKYKTKYIKLVGSTYNYRND